MKPHELSIESPVFAGTLLMLGNEINSTITDLVKKDLSEGSVTLKIKIGIMKSPDEDGVFHNTVLFDPKLKSSIGRSTEDKLGGTGGRIEINKEGKIIIGTNQISMDELIDEQKGA